MRYLTTNYVQFTALGALFSVSSAALGLTLGYPMGYALNTIRVCATMLAVTTAFYVVSMGVAFATRLINGMSEEEEEEDNDE